MHEIKLRRKWHDDECLRDGARDHDIRTTTQFELIVDRSMDRETGARIEGANAALTRR
jgi:hypothetical protein